MKKTKKEIYDYCMPQALMRLELNLAIHQWQNAKDSEETIKAFADFMDLWEKNGKKGFELTEWGWQQYVEQYDEFYSSDLFSLEELFNNAMVRLLDEEDEIYEDEEVPNYNDEL